ncbi:MAG: hypothetical protein KDE64_12720 [Rhodocyclaceae bacterium]|nr:hypothetical protein [Rhodocyclaceae bacterium]
MTPTRTLYDVLQVSPHAEPEIIKAAYALLLRKRDGGTDPGTLRLMKDAFETLIDPASRASYDAKLRDAQPAPASTVTAAEPALDSPPSAWARWLLIALAFAGGYTGASMWHQRTITQMILDHEAALASQQAEIARLSLDQRAREFETRSSQSEAAREQRAREAQARQRERELAATKARLDRESAVYQRTREREEQAREREALRRIEQTRRERAAEDARNARLAQQRLANEKRELERLYRENYPQYR